MSDGFAVRLNGLGDHSKGFGICSNGFGVCSNGFGVRSNGFGVRSNVFGVCSNGLGVRSNGFGVCLSGSWNPFEQFIRSVWTAFPNRSRSMSNCLNGFGSRLSGLPSRLLSVYNLFFCPFECKSVKVCFPRAGHIWP